MEIVKSVSVLLVISVVQLNAALTCPEAVDGQEVFLPSKTNCEEYFHCVHGVPVEMKCPDGLYWDQSKQFCNWPDQVSPPCTAKCPSEGWFRRDGVSNCYLFGTEKMNFDEAKQFCTDNGGMLVEPRTKRETRVINKLINRKAGDDSYWIGLTDQENEGTFLWESDNTEVSYSNWDSNEPNNSRGKEDCVHLRKAVSHRWNDSTCGSKNGNTALCQKF